MPMTIFSIFIALTIIFSSCSSSRRNVECQDFKTGRFALRSKLDNSISIIERNDSIQTERNTKTGDLVRAKISWTDECVYELTYFDESTDSIEKDLKGRPLKTEILFKTNNYYVFRSSMEGINLTVVDTLKVLSGDGNASEN